MRPWCDWAALAGTQRVLDSLRGMRRERVLADVTAMEQRADALPHRRANLALNDCFGRRWREAARLAGRGRGGLGQGTGG